MRVGALLGAFDFNFLSSFNCGRSTLKVMFLQPLAGSVLNYSFGMFVKVAVEVNEKLCDYRDKFKKGYLDDSPPDSK
jgi:hypothetical protein